MSLTLNTSNLRSVHRKARVSGINTFDKLEKATAKTHKGAPSYSIGSSHPLSVLFVKAVRGMDCATEWSSTDDREAFLEFLLDEVWQRDPLDCLKMIANIRDCRIGNDGTGGKGEKAIFYASMWWLMRKNINVARHFMKHIAFYGCWRDYLVIFCGTPLEPEMTKLWAAQLQNDLALITAGKPREIDMSAAKYAPNENSAFDRSHAIVCKICSHLPNGTNAAKYRKNFLRPLRSAWTSEEGGMTIVEEQMCANNWDKIDFSKVPSRAMKLYIKAFKKHVPTRIEAFYEALKAGDSKVKLNVKQLQPHEIVSQYTDVCGYGWRPNDPKPDVDMAWTQHIKNICEQRQKIIKERGVDNDEIFTVPICDVSGSMFRGAGSVHPINGALALALTLAITEPENSPFYRRWLNFSDNPSIQTLRGETLGEILNNINWNDWAGTTNYIAAFKLAVELIKFVDPATRHIIRFVVASDMQFDDCGGRDTNWNEMNKIAKQYNVEYEIVFWNLNSRSLDMPIPHDKIEGVTMLAGFSASFMNELYKGQVPSLWNMVRRILDSERYARITLPEDFKD